MVDRKTTVSRYEVQGLSAAKTVMGRIIYPHQEHILFAIVLC